jgi:hypothetical protein
MLGKGSESNSSNLTDERIRNKQVLGDEWAIQVSNKLAFGDC